MRCGVTKKIMFKTHEAALVRAGEILNDQKRRDKVATFRAYQCQYCGGYHLTSK